jgi:hypothetical protein
MTLNILVVNWNSSGALAKCLASIAACQFDSYRVIIVDNCSSPDDLAGLKDLESLYVKAPFVFLRNEENRGYAGGNNSGLQYLVQHGLDGDILIVNPDVTMRPDTLQIMASAAVGDVGIVVPRVVDPQGKVLFDRIRLSGFLQRNIVDSEPSEAYSDIAQGTCMLIRRCVVDSIGLFDERFFLYWEEVDLSLRARAVGYRIVAVNKTSVIKGHNAPARIPPCLYYSVRNANLIRKLHPRQFSFAGYFLYTIRIALLCFKLIGHRQLFSEAWVSVAKGLRDGMIGQYGARKAA